MWLLNISTLLKWTNYCRIWQGAVHNAEGRPWTNQPPPKKKDPIWLIRLFYCVCILLNHKPVGSLVRLGSPFSVRGYRDHCVLTFGKIKSDFGNELVKDF